MKNCWPWSHDWTKWEPSSWYTLHTKDDSVVASGIVIARTCTKCGLIQTRRVADLETDYKRKPQS